MVPPAKDDGEALVAATEEFQPDYILLAGYMRIIGSAFIRRYPMQIINIHPSLLPAFPGLKAPQQALDAGVKFTGTTVHFVVEEVDAGPIIAQAVVPVLPNDSFDSLEARILEKEHALYPAVVKGLAEGSIYYNAQTKTVVCPQKPELHGLGLQSMPTQ